MEKPFISLIALPSAEEAGAPKTRAVPGAEYIRAEAGETLKELLEKCKGCFVALICENDRFEPDFFAKLKTVLSAHDAECDVFSVPVKLTEKAPADGGEPSFTAADAESDFTLAETLCKHPRLYFIRREKIAERLPGARMMRDAEMAAVLTALRDRPVLGMIGGCRCTRRPEDRYDVMAESLKWDFYVDSMENFMLPALRDGAPRYAQYAVLSMLRFRLHMKYIPKGTLSLEEEETYLARVKELLGLIDDSVIHAEPLIGPVLKLHILGLKHGGILRWAEETGSGELLDRYLSGCPVNLRGLKLKKDYMELNGELEVPEGWEQEPALCIEAGSESCAAPLLPTCTATRCMGVSAGTFHTFRVKIPLKGNGAGIMFRLTWNGRNFLLDGGVTYAGTFPISRKAAYDFCSGSGWKVEPFSGGVLPVRKRNALQCAGSYAKGLAVNAAKGKAPAYLKHKLENWFRAMPPKYILFESMPSYSDNALMLYRYFQENGLLKDYKFIWYTNKKDPAELIRRKGFKAVYGSRPTDPLKRLSYRYHMCRAKAAIFGNRFIMRLRDDTITFNLGHGSCLKSVHGHYDMPRNLDYLLIQSGFFEEPTRYEHSLNRQTVTMPLGYPRNDELVKDRTAERPAWRTEDKLIIWYPTWRQNNNGRVNLVSTGMPIIHDTEAARKINDCAKEHGVQILLKPHFSQDLSKLDLSSMSNLQVIRDDFFKVNNILSYELLSMSDALITDYSSVYYDYLLTGKPIGLAWEDFDEYKAREGFAVDTDRICAGGEKIYTADDFCAFIERVAKGEDPLKEQRQEINRLANAFTDGTSTEKVAKWISGIIENSEK